MRRLAFLVEVSVVKAKYVQIMGFIYQHMSVKFGKNTSALLKWGTRPNETHNKCREPYAKANTDLGQIQLLILWTTVQWESCITQNTFFCISQLYKSQLYIEICSLFIYSCKLSQFYCVNARCLMPRPMQLDQFRLLYKAVLELW